DPSVLANQGSRREQVTLGRPAAEVLRCQAQLIVGQPVVRLEVLVAGAGRAAASARSAWRSALRDCSSAAPPRPAAATARAAATAVTARSLRLIRPCRAASWRAPSGAVRRAACVAAGHAGPRVGRAAGPA